MNFIDLTHVILPDKYSVYYGLPAPVMESYISHNESKGKYAAGTSFEISRATLIGNSGTYLNAPFHRYPDGHDISHYQLKDTCGLEGTVIDVSDLPEGAIPLSAIEKKDISHKAVLFHTGESLGWGTQAYTSQRYWLSKEAALYCKKMQIKLVGVDNKNIDYEKDMERPVHSIFLGSGIPEVGNLCNLQCLIQRHFVFFAAVVKIARMSSFPCRAFALID